MARVSAIGSEYVNLVLTRREAEALYSHSPMLSAETYRDRLAIAHPLHPPFDGASFAASRRAVLALAEGVRQIRGEG